MNLLFDDFRKKWLEATAEEKVRQNLLHFMVKKKGFPKSHIGVERKVTTLCDSFLQQEKNYRRFDIVCYSPKISSVLLLIECKKKISLRKDFTQLLGYNKKMNAPFFALADEKGIFTFFFKEEKLEKLPFLPTYQELLDECL